MTDLIIYTTEDGRSQIRLRADQHTVWLTQLEMAELFDATKQNISLHLKNIYEDGELDAAAVVKESLTVQIEGSREAQRPVTRYNLRWSHKPVPLFAPKGRWIPAQGATLGMGWRIRMRSEGTPHRLGRGSPPLP